MCSNLRKFTNESDFTTNTSCKRHSVFQTEYGAFQSLFGAKCTPYLGARVYARSGVKGLSTYSLKTAQQNPCILPNCGKQVKKHLFKKFQEQGTLLNFEIFRSQNPVGNLFFLPDLYLFILPIHVTSDRNMQCSKYCIVWHFQALPVL